MYRRRVRPSTRDHAAPSEMPEQAGPSATPDLREQLAALTKATRQQGALLQRMCETFTPPLSTAPRAPEQSAPPPTTPVAAPATAEPPPVTVPTTPVTFSGEASQMFETEQERMTERLARFHRFDPPRFDGSCTEPWVVEGRVSVIEKLFEDLFIAEWEHVHLGVHCLAGDVHSWWRRMRQTPGLVALQIKWDEFCVLLYGA
uniref:Retrotransposon gag domain-containing protein n=1 Tax=Ananas comosus var. bracteatus TaxID=296719 RepID=A0A6V7PS24_ANACO|nr:unnamed protein product [Ananas comosus var. bracteatus]